MASRAIANTEAKAPAKIPVSTGGKLAAFVPQTLDEAWRLAGALASSGMTPKSYGNDQNKIMVGIMAGAEVGLTPFASLQSIAVIGNNPSLWGDGALALVQASGLLEDMEESDDGHTATCMMKRIGRATAIVRNFSMDDAKKAGLAGKAGPWTQYTARMRQMRARAFTMRDGFADVLKGLHIAEEARDYTSTASSEQMTVQPLSAAMLIEQSGEQSDYVATSEPGKINGIPPAHESEGRANEDMGEGFIDDQPAWAIPMAVISKALSIADSTRSVTAAETEFLNIKPGLPDDIAASFETELAEKRKFLRRG